ncbi:lipid-A-disaccharide synthase N-terminal domain-containing protein [Aliiroseovarius sp. M344]|nr:lipid-A-disaccharide synthase N-terminal domain-containing protein [Aliiroseovarius sp. M344]
MASVGKVMSISSIWLGIGFLGQLLFTSRFLVQWIVSERRGESVVPLAFWWFSLAGGLTLLSYAIWRQDPVFILGQATGLFVYVRNLILIRRRKAEASS